MSVPALSLHAGVPLAHLSDEDLTVDFNEVTTPEDRVAVIATTALTDNEAWNDIPAGTLIAFQNGHPVELGPGATVAPHAPGQGPGAPAAAKPGAAPAAAPAAKG